MIKNIFVISTTIIFLFNAVLYSQTTPEYQLVAKNFNRSAQDSLTFDIYILHTNPSSGNFEYSLGQFFFRFNPNIANGGTLTYRIIGSDLPTNLRPRNPTVFSNELRLATNATPGAGFGYIVSSNSPGTLVVRMSLKTSATAFSTTENFNISWKNNEHGNPYTKVFAYVGTVNTEITNPSNHIIDKMVSVNSITNQIPDEYEVYQNYPNPFNPSTKIKFSVPVAGNVSLKIFDTQGRLVKDFGEVNFDAGIHELEFNAGGLSSGIYFYRFRANNYIHTGKMTLLK